MSSGGNFATDGTLTQVALTNVASTLVAAETTNGARRGLYITNPVGNTGNLYLSFGSTNPTSTMYGMKIPPNGQAVDVNQVPYQGPILAILDVAGPESVNVNRVI